ncbi:hypothetical protein HPB50_001715 [Hyalomma asiaticum]|uniref:Uncharacterized protein n=1 Tax=Hyalomma asiaticum TaxID=266040 RepID=A0ACB7SQW3_HYAAI|nr:hypothetical protein HPB50_001715 [Hyalomma asiaticum]
MVFGQPSQWVWVREHKHSSSNNIRSSDSTPWRPSRGGHASGAAMTWGARTLVIAATTALLLQLDTWYTLAATVEKKPWLITRSTNSTGVAVAAKPRPVSGDSEILIEHVDDDDSVVLMPLVVAVLVLVAFVFVVLLVLACLLVMRLLESRKGTKYHRLHSSETYGSETYERRRHRSRTGRSKHSQVFTYVDLSNADCSCLEHGVEGGKENAQQAPRFAVQFQSATNVDVKDANARTDRQEAPAPAPRRSRMATMGLPSGEHDAAEDAQQLRRAQVVEGNANAASQSANFPSDHPVESPTLHMYAQNAAWGSPGYHSDSTAEVSEFDIFRERCAKLTSVVPRMEIQVRDRCVKKHPSSGSRKSPMKYRGFDREVEKVMTGHTTEASGTTYPGLYISLPSDMGSPRESYDVSSDVQSSPEFSPSGPIASAPAIGAASVNTSPFRAEDADVFSCGQYHRNRDYGEAGNAVTTNVTERQSSEVSSASRDYEKFLTEAHPTKPGHSDNALMELPDTRVAPRDGSAVKSSNSARLRELFEREAAKARLSDATIRKPAASTSSSRDLSVQVPQMVAYFDRARTEKSLKAATEGASESQAATRSLSTDASLTTLPEAEPPAPVSSANRIAASTGRIRLPQPPTERSKKDIHVKLPDEELAARSESSQPT